MPGQRTRLHRLTRDGNFPAVRLGFAIAGSFLLPSSLLAVVASGARVAQGSHQVVKPRGLLGLQEVELAREAHKVAEHGVEVAVEVQANRLAEVAPVDVRNHMVQQPEELAHHRFERVREVPAVFCRENRFIGDRRLDARHDVVDVLWTRALHLLPPLVLPEVLYVAGRHEGAGFRCAEFRDGAILQVHVSKECCDVCGEPLVELDGGWQGDEWTQLRLGDACPHVVGLQVEASLLGGTLLLVLAATPPLAVGGAPSIVGSTRGRRGQAEEIKHFHGARKEVLAARGGAMFHS